MRATRFIKKFDQLLYLIRAGAEKYQSKTKAPFKPIRPIGLFDAALGPQGSKMRVRWQISHRRTAGRLSPCGFQLWIAQPHPAR